MISRRIVHPDGIAKDERVNDWAMRMLARLTEDMRDAIRWAWREKKPIVVEVKEWRRKRSTEQNARYWALVQRIAEATGHDKSEIHDYLRLRFLPHRVIKIGGKEAVVPMSTTELSVAEFGEYMEQVEAWAATTLGVALPDDWGRERWAA